MAHFFVPYEVHAMDKEGLISLLEPAVNALGYELVDLDVRSGRNGLLRLFIDNEAGVNLSDCEFVSKQVGDLLDVEDPIPGNYNLEVSSPGLDRKLTKSEHFQRFTGETVKVQMRFPIEGRRRFRGTLVASDDENIVVEVDGESHTLPVATIDTARLVPGGN